MSRLESILRLWPDFCPKRTSKVSGLKVKISFLKKETNERMNKDIQKADTISKWAPLLGTLLLHAVVFLLLAVNVRGLKDRFLQSKINEIIEFIEFQDLSGGYESTMPPLPAPLVPIEPKMIIEKIETEELLTMNSELPDDFTAEVNTRDDRGTDTMEVVDVSATGGQGGYGDGLTGISDYKLPTFLGRDYNYFHIWFQDQFKYPAEMKDRYITQVMVVFMVDAEGNVTRVSVRNCSNDLIAQEINRVMKLSPKWSPAQRGGRNINHYFQLPVNIN
ncbi:MAG: energy transducer TonB [Bacteroidales bacterium]|nr:energy transducer TonB [Bacteroidales bacterium]